MNETILKGFELGVAVVACMLPIAVFSIVWSWLGPLLRKPKNQTPLQAFLDTPPDLPENEPEPEPEPEYRFTASTIIRPPHIIQRKDEDED